MTIQIQTTDEESQRRCRELTRTNDQRRPLDFSYLDKRLKLDARSADSIREYVQARLLRDRKLILILDLDHTLLHSIPRRELSPELQHIQGDQNQSLFLLEHFLTKLRPFVHDFLKEASSMFDMYIYTMGSRCYAQDMAKLLDPDEAYFKSKIISREYCTECDQKGLDVVLAPENIVIILDDTECVWKKHRDNLILMRRYYYFPSNPLHLPFGFDVLNNILHVLKRAHHMFFDSEVGTKLFSRDVREVLQKIRRGVLQGCRIALFCTESVVNDYRVWSIAQELGATCVTEVDTSITHVVSTQRKAPGAQWALQNNKFLVSPSWITAAYHMWHRQPEEHFSTPT